MPRPKPLSGFPEFLPGDRIVEQRVLEVLTGVFELHGFGSIATRAVEPLEVLAGKGEIDKEVYVVRRLHAEDESTDRLGLHYDLTVPFARYVLENAGHLQFPFRRYQVQTVWRGERPQEGRYREFTQADLDIVGADTLGDHHDTEIVLAALDGFERLHTELGFPTVVMRVNNRKLSEGFYRGLGVTDTPAVLRIVDKLDKIGPEKVAAQLVSELGLSAEAAGQCLALAGIRTADETFVDRVRALGVTSDLLDEGLALLSELVRAANALVPGRVVADLSIARGLDYYTGTVFETELAGLESLGSVASGGRYDQLANDGKRTYPGVGFSFGISRMLVPMINKGLYGASRPVPTCVLVAVDDEESRGRAVEVATQLRARGIASEVAPKADKFGKQIRHADRRGIPYVWFGSAGSGAAGEVKDIRTGEQAPADPATWQPAPDAVRPQVRATPA
ncbi:MAG: histidine--tRNA ligase [Propionibacteriales bacterium]|nr:histidine--tRNA ligase [Propionibacteriales bacterium]